LEYDDVLNRHREVVYTRRKEILTLYKKQKDQLENNSEASTAPEEITLRARIFEMLEAEIEQVVSFHTNTEDRQEWNLKEIAETIATIFPVTAEEKTKITTVPEAQSGRLGEAQVREQIVKYLIELAHAKYQQFLVGKINDERLMLEIEKQVLLRGIDNLWVDHLVAIDYLRTGIGLRGYGQRDPLVEYKKETFRMFNQLLSSIQNEVVYTIFKVAAGLSFAPSVMQNSKLTLQGAPKNADEQGGKVVSATNKDKDSEGNKIGRNDLCPCGSGKKYKKCHGK